MLAEPQARRVPTATTRTVRILLLVMRDNVAAHLPPPRTQV
jgi:hypothetical protein